MSDFNSFDELFDKLEEDMLSVVNNELKEETAFEILNKLKQIPKFKIPVIVAIDKEKEFIKEHFINDGFKDYLLFIFRRNFNRLYNKLMHRMLRKKVK